MKRIKRMCFDALPHAWFQITMCHTEIIELCIRCSQATKILLVEAENNLNAACVSAQRPKFFLIALIKCTGLLCPVCLPSMLECLYCTTIVLLCMLQLQLELKTKEVSDAAGLSQQQGRTIMELQQQIKMLEGRLNPRVGGGGQDTSAGISGSYAQQQQLGATPRLGMHMVATVRFRNACSFDT